ncbi:DUF6778 family protein [Pseudoponticoccus marisrubri]|uniref:Lipoprotein n=1 Tax=Pseudoponticoccus marisrubri TaxID=1685382 RepID=A0A0W7WDW7_9RHOB|nr:DUF6778 family protein [Pseudoponticoccus marisrubri]KUF08835.1 hypothetical protein AVJ23_20775 [Pseudoponticoccus marisrubri]
MTPLRIAAGLFVIAGLSACGAAPKVARNAPFEPVPAETRIAAPAQTASLALAAPARRDLRIADVAIEIPKDLTVSEANLYYPVADIVWRGDPYGPRKPQVAAILREAADRARAELDGSRPARVEIRLDRFHSITEKARYTLGGVHSITFHLNIIDMETGAHIVRGRKVKADLRGFGADKALEAEHAGLGMKERIQRHLARVIAAEVGQPEGWTEKGIAEGDAPATF